MENREREEDVDNPSAPAPPVPTPAPVVQALPQLPQGLPYYGGPYYAGAQAQQPGQLMHQAAQAIPQPAQALQQQAAQALQQQAAQVLQQQAAQVLQHQAAQLVLPQQFHQALAFGGPSSPQHSAMAGPSSPLVHLQPQYPSPARGGSRGHSSNTVTLPWEKRSNSGRPNATDCMLKKLYEEGRIAPPSAFQWQQYGHFFPPPPVPYAQPAAPSFFPAAAAPPSVPASAFVPQQLPSPALVPQQTVASAASPSAAAGPSGGAHSSTSGQRPECRYCRSDTPDGFLRCGHALCQACFARLKTNSTECPDPRCSGSLDDDSFTGMKL